MLRRSLNVGGRAIAVAALVALCLPQPALAGPGGSQSRAWVSGLGADNASCGGITTPCRTFQFAHDSIVAPAGTIYVKDPANYSQLVITHALSIVNDGAGTATIFAPSGAAIAIAAGASDKIFIKGLILDGVGTGANGINLTSAGGLTVTGATIKGFGAISGFNGNGILVHPASGLVLVDISDTLAIGNANVGIWIDRAVDGNASTANVPVSLTRVQASGNKIGVVAINGGPGGVAIVASEVSANNNAQDGFVCGGLSAKLFLSRSTASGNLQYGVNNGGNIFSAGDNFIFDNATNVSIPMASGPLQ